VATTEDGDIGTALRALQTELVAAQAEVQHDPTSIRWWTRVATAFDAVAISVAGSTVSAAPHQAGELFRLYSPWT
jgi:hypothetical protein